MNLLPPLFLSRGVHMSETIDAVMAEDERVKEMSALRKAIIRPELSLDFCWFCFGLYAPQQQALFDDANQGANANAHDG